jgi:hypothetical protein
MGCFAPVGRTEEHCCIADLSSELRVPPDCSGEQFIVTSKPALSGPEASPSRPHVEIHDDAFYKRRDPNSPDSPELRMESPVNGQNGYVFTRRQPREVLPIE